MLHPTSLSLLRMTSVASLSICEEAHRLSEIVQDAIGDIRHYRKQIERGHAAFRDQIRYAEQRRDLNLAKLGELLTIEGYDEQDGIIVGSELYTLEATGSDMKVQIGERWEDCPAHVARHVGPSPLPGHDDSDDHDEVAEWASHYQVATYAG